jgi:hypothetical protein
MEWGIMITAVAMVGMLGIAMHEATTGGTPPSKPRAKRPFVSEKEKVKKAA